MKDRIIQIETVPENEYMVWRQYALGESGNLYYRCMDGEWKLAAMSPELPA